MTTAGAVAHATGQVAAFLSQNNCTDLVRELYSATVQGRPVTLAVSIVQLNASATDSFMSLISADGTGDITTLIADGQNYAGGPNSFAGDPAFLAKQSQLSC